MPFDPTLPADHSDLSSAEVRGQLNSLKALMDAQAAQITALQNQLSAQEGRWDTLDNQLAILNPLNIGAGDPLTQDEVQTVAARADDMLAALKAA